MREYGGKFGKVWEGVEGVGRLGRLVPWLDYF